MLPRVLSEFRAIYCSGAFVPDADAVVALALLFEKVHLPNNIEFIREFATKYRIIGAPKKDLSEDLRVVSQEGDDAFADLTAEQKETARQYVLWAISFAFQNAELLGEVFESELFGSKELISVELIEQGGLGKLNKYRVSIGKMGALTSGDAAGFTKFIEAGYVPVVGSFHEASPMAGHRDHATAKQLAALLAMKSVQMILPRTRSARAEVILEARHRLRDQLPPFWSAMLKSSVELKKLIADSKSHYDVGREATDLVDRTIRPAVIDLGAKLEKERKDWFYRILSPVRSGLRLMIGNPPLTQQQLLTNALVLASDTCVSIADNIRTIESLKAEAGLSYLLDLSAMLSLEGEKT